MASPIQNPIPNWILANKAQLDIVEPNRDRWRKVAFIAGGVALLALAAAVAVTAIMLMDVFMAVSFLAITGAPSAMLPIYAVITPSVVSIAAGIFALIAYKTSDEPAYQSLLKEKAELEEWNDCWAPGNQRGLAATIAKEIGEGQPLSRDIVRNGFTILNAREAIHRELHPDQARAVAAS